VARARFWKILLALISYPEALALSPEGHWNFVLFIWIHVTSLYKIGKTDGIPYAIFENDQAGKKYTNFT
jgi:hypothetical protein